MNTSPYSGPAWLRAGLIRRRMTRCRRPKVQPVGFRPSALLRLCVPAAALFCFWLAAAALAADPPADAPREPINIVADRLLTDSNARRAEFSGNVTATQGDTRLTSDRLVIFYTGSGPQTAPQESVQRIEAYGNVRINMADRVATTDQAVYTAADRKLVLTGPGSKITRGQDEITGNEIIFDRERQTVTVESRGKGQVNAVIHSDQRGLN